MTEQLSPLDDFLAHPDKYNTKSVADTIAHLVERSSHLTGGPVNVTIRDVDDSKLIRDVLKWCLDHSEPIHKIEKAIDLMVSSWERAKLMELVEAISAKSGAI